MIFFAAAFLLVFAGSASAAVTAERVVYRHGDEEFEGYLAYDDATDAPRPGVVVVHEWTGLGKYPETRARQLAELGYIAFAIDMYGKGVHPEDPAEAGEWSGKFKKDRPLMRSRAFAGFEVLQKHPLADPARIAVIGYCFGGTVALELARGGADARGFVSFHGTLGTPNKEDARNIKGRVLVLHGGSDPHVSDEQVKEFEDEMRAAGAQWKMVVYGGAVHSFTNPDSGSDPSTGAAYNAEADRDSWVQMRHFFEDIFAPPPAPDR